ncbi:hypothetical protein FA13DRAFT_1800241 [Coprinellus micaceus]|uniref:DUF6533 domain-containing protein n=1 Tax=Coprinellus micaceus TaxID=71717 RepID=A0A4Y7SGZ3_COPMI|nr:hypothetical protein FA13DRAFT_1800241 [Coprinellus micaceus]
MPLVKGPDVSSYPGGPADVIRQFTETNVYHYCLTIGEEVTYIWSHRWTTGRILFTMARYLPMLRIASSILLEVRMKTVFPTGACRALAFIFMLSHLFASIAADGTFVLCIYALLGSRRRWMLVLGTLYIGVSIPLLVLTVLYLLGRESKLPGSGVEAELGYACGFYSGKSDKYGGVMDYLTIGVTMIVATIGTVVVVIRYRDHKSKLLDVFRKDGTVFYVLALSLRLTAALVDTPGIANFDRYNIAWSLHALIIPILATKLMTHLRKTNEHALSSTVISSLIFEHHQDGPFSLDPLQTKDR